MTVLTISDITIRRDASGRYCLNDLHRAAGDAQRHRPKYWLDNQQTQDLLAEVSIGGIPPIEAKQGLGTFVCRELVYAYAMWISPAFHLKVIRAYDHLITHAAAPTWNPSTLLNDPATMRNWLLAYTEKVLALEDTVQKVTPKAAALDRITAADGSFCLTDAAKTLQLRPKDLIEWLQANQWVYRRQGERAYLAYQNRIQTGLMAMKIHIVVRSDGTARSVEQARITAKGLARLSELVPTKPRLVA
jgi:phage antirepressor YoqD-like protein